jgi:hypothetical protein
VHARSVSLNIIAQVRTPLEGRAPVGWLVGLVIALCPQTRQHIRGGWSHYTDTSEPVDGYGAQNMEAGTQFYD